MELILDARNKKHVVEPARARVQAELTPTIALTIYRNLWNLEMNFKKLSDRKLLGKTHKWNLLGTRNERNLFGNILNEWNWLGMKN